MLLNNLNISTSYDISADSLKWAPVRISAGTLLFNDKMNINLATTLNPYALNNKGQLINTYNINNGGSLFRMTSANATLNYSLSNKNKDDKKKKTNKVLKMVDVETIYLDQMQTSATIKKPFLKRMKKKMPLPIFLKPKFLGI